MPGRYHPSSGGTNPRHGVGGNNKGSLGVGGGVSANPSSSSLGGGNGGSGSGPPPPLTPQSQSLARLRVSAVSHPAQQVRLTLYVPPRAVGAVIGRGGRTVLSVQREASRRSGGHLGPVRVSVLGGGGVGGGGGGGIGGGGSDAAAWNYRKRGPRGDADDDDDDDDDESKGNVDCYDDENGYAVDEWTPVIIRGDPLGTFAAVRQLLSLVENEHDAHIVLDVPIHASRHNLLIGRGGITLAALSATYDTRIMIPPNEYMNDVYNGVGSASGSGGEDGSMTDDDGTENVWKQRQRQQQMRQRRADVGSSMLFGGDAAGGGAASGAAAASSSSSSSSSSSMQQMQQMQQQSQMPGGASPPNVVQLEGTIENVERCLVKIFGIVTGDIWTPTGTIVERAAVENGVIGGRKESGMTKATTTTTTTTTTAATQASTSTSKTNASATIAPLGDPPSSTAATTHPPGRGREETPASTTAEAVIVKVWTPTSKILNLGKIRKVQRKTNTIIRRKKLRLVGSSGGGSANVSNIANEKEEDVADDNEASDNDDEEGLRESSPEGGPKSATKYIISGKTESVRSAASQFEKILGLEPGSSVITDTTNKGSGSNNRKPISDGVGGSRYGNNTNEDANVNRGGIKPDVESADVGGGCAEPGGKRLPSRRKKKNRGGKVGGNERPSSRGSKEERSRTPVSPPTEP